jgi:hypothetical protein
LTGIDVSDISGHTTALQRLGWLKKRNASGQTTRYALTVPTYAVDRFKTVQAAAAARRDASMGNVEIEVALREAAVAL